MILGIFTKIYWKFILVVCLIAFAYGLGSSIPREIRKALKGYESSGKNTKE
jgi:hypothetical protein